MYFMSYMPTDYSKKIVTSMSFDEWIWFMPSVNVQTQQISIILYYAGQEKWVYRVNPGPYSSLAYTDMILYLGTQGPYNAGAFTYRGQLRDLFVYHGITANSVGLDKTLLRKLMKFPDSVYAAFAVNSLQQEYYDVVSVGASVPNARLTLGATSAVEPTKDPAFHITRGLQFEAGRFATLKLNLTSSEILIQYWSYKHSFVNDYNSFIVYQHKQASYELITVTHVKHALKEFFSIKLCVNKNCINTAT